VGTQDINEQVRGIGALDRVRLGKGGGRIAPRKLEHADVVAGIRIELRKLGVRAERHGEKELDAVLFARLHQYRDAIEQAIGALLG
jgi:hypothetical protein